MTVLESFYTPFWRSFRNELDPRYLDAFLRAGGGTLEQYELIGVKWEIHNSINNGRFLLTSSVTLRYTSDSKSKNPCSNSNRTIKKREKSL